MDFLRIGPNLIAAAEGGHGSDSHFLSYAAVYVLTAICVVSLFIFLQIAKKGFGPRVFTNGPAKLFEQAYLFVENLCLSIIGPEGRRYTTFIFTIWVVIFISNVMALFFPSAPTADLSFNIGLAVVALAYVTYEGIRINGFGHFIGHFFGPKLPIYFVLISIIIFVVEIVSYLMRLVSLPLRLYGNIEGGHMAADAMSSIVKLDIAGIIFKLPLGALLLPIKLLTVIVQAFIFVLLTCVYIQLLMPHHDHDEEHGHAPHPEGAH
ncbi:MAG: F0F1 ATP synthase subunit A [Fimbriimonadaceae bacterium]